MSIFVCGDIHSTLDINKLDRFIGREDLNENDYLIISQSFYLCFHVPDLNALFKGSTTLK